MRRLRLKLWRQKNWLLHHYTLPLSTKTMTVFPHQPHSPDLAPCYFSQFSRLKTKLKGRHFDTVEVMEAELQAVLNSLTEHDFQHTFNEWQKR
jgi:hypothetical protein